MASAALAKAKEAAKAARERASRIASRVKPGPVGAAWSAGTGIAAFYVVRELYARGEKEGVDASGKPKSMLAQPYTVPLMLAGGGYLVRQQVHNTVGTGMIAIGLFLGANAWQTEQDKKKKAAGGGATPSGTPSSSMGGGASGWEMMDGGMGAGALPSNIDTSGGALTSGTAAASRAALGPGGVADSYTVDEAMAIVD